MAFGLRIKGSHGVAQIDHTYRNLTLREKGTLTLNTRDFSFSEPIYGATLGPKSGLTTPVLALRPDSATQAGVWYAAKDGSSNWTWLVNGRNTGGTSGGTVDWFLFDVALAGAEPTSGFGLVIKNPTTGAVAFHHQMKPMRVKGATEGGRIYAMAIADPAYTYAYTDLGPAFDMAPYHDYGYYSEMNAVGALGTTIGRMPLSNFITQYIPGSQPGDQALPASYATTLLLDVTHF